MLPHCADEEKYGVAERETARFNEMHERGETLGGAAITDLVTVNGAWVSTEDGSWGLVRASSNKPRLVVVVESSMSRARLEEMFRAVNGMLRENLQVGAYN